MKIVNEIDAIYDLSGFIATLDIILSLAAVWFYFFTFFKRILREFLRKKPFISWQISGNDGYVRPVFGDEMRIVDAIHPLLDQNIHQTVPVPNSIVNYFGILIILGKIFDYFTIITNNFNIFIGISNKISDSNTWLQFFHH